MKLSTHSIGGGVTRNRRRGRGAAVLATALGLALALPAGTAHADAPAGDRAAPPATAGQEALPGAAGQEALPATANPTHTAEATVALSDLSALPRAGGSEARSAVAASYLFQYVRNRHGGQCLDGDRNTIPANGARVQLWACNGWTNQAWIFTSVSGYPVGYYRVQNYHGRQCLDGDRNTIPANGSRVQLWACNGWTA
ncbi:RICIN domain-containing protein [Plantactinospora sp. CA-290183]|uniref:RICIN domain-containing protein n=1 Tax=Plantactinospora sp. CA-290183 TaxID=3240006 RepID=UPI003D8FED63